MWFFVRFWRLVCGLVDGLFVCLLLAVFVGLGNYAAGLCCFGLWFRWLGLVIWYLSWAGCLVY